MSFRLSPLEERALAEDALPDLPVQLRVRGRYFVPVDGVEDAEIEVRFNSAELADLVAQGRAAQLTLAQRARREAEMAGTVAEATQLAHGGVAQDDAATLERVVVGLRAMPDEAPAKDSSQRGAAPRAGGSANGKPVGGDEVREYVQETPRVSWTCKPPLPRRQPGKGGL
ncbi:hypothetical protein ACFVXC_05680 [Streptomyces sp. NPDC058257]|uniref:hypothetical protein n=1 Tax=Streptomyces sp. NPDC058257 TaxID=3346409 RepID=UPI0036E44C5E